jgi:anti-sigma factor RsiW
LGQGIGVTSMHYSRMTCRQFRSQHAAYVDDLMSSATSHAMRAHLMACPRCASADVAIRRSLMVMRSLPPIQVSPDFRSRLDERLRIERLERATTARLPESGRDVGFGNTTRATIAAGLLLLIGAAYTLATHRREGPAHVAKSSVALGAPVRVSPFVDQTTPAMVPPGVPVWSAVYAAGQLPLQYVTMDLTEVAGR